MHGDHHWRHRKIRRSHRFRQAVGNYRSCGWERADHCERRNKQVARGNRGNANQLTVDDRRPSPAWSFMFGA